MEDRNKESPSITLLRAEFPFLFRCSRNWKRRSERKRMQFARNARGIINCKTNIRIRNELNFRCSIGYCSFWALLFMFLDALIAFIVRDRLLGTSNDNVKQLKRSSSRFYSELSCCGLLKSDSDLEFQKRSKLNAKLRGKVWNLLWKLGTFLNETK